MSTAQLSALPAFPVCELCKRIEKTDVGENESSASSLNFTPTRWNPSCLCLFTRLPDKYLVGFIFPFLDIDSLVKSSQTCTRWRALAEDPSLYKNLHVDSLTTEAEAKAFKVLSRRRMGDLVETLKVKVGGASQDASSRLSASTFSARLSRLSALSFLGSKSKTNADDVTSFVVAHPTLRRLILDGVTTIRDEHIRDMLNGLKGGGGLRQLNVNQCRGLTDDFLNCLAASDSAQTLEILSFEGCVQFSSSNLIAFLRAGGGRNLRKLYARGIRGSNDTLCNVLSTCCPYLEELDISNENPFGTSESSISDRGLYSLASALADKLRTLRIQGHVQVTDAGLASTLSMLPLIEVIDTRGCRLVGDLSASALSESKGRKGLLREVRFFGSSLTDDGLQMLASVLCYDTIEIVDLFGCKKLTFEGVKTFVESLSISRSSSSNKVRPNTTICLGGIRCLQFPTVKADLLSRSSSMKILFN